MVSMNPAIEMSKVFKGLSLIDETFDAKFLPNYHLFIQLGKDGLVCCVMDTLRNKFIAFENYTFQSIHNSEAFSESIQQLIKEDNLLSRSARAKNVKLMWVGNKSTIIPNALFDPLNKENYLKFNHTLAADEIAAVDNLKMSDAKNIYALPSGVEKTLKNVFRNISLHHYSTPLIENLLSKYKNESTKKMVVHVQVDHFEIIVTEGKTLLFYNTFSYQTSEDFIYYVLFVAEQLKLNPEQMDLTLIGEIDKDSALYLMLYKYVRNVKFGERTNDCEYSYKFDNLPKHYYYNLFNLNFLANY